MKKIIRLCRVNGRFLVIVILVVLICPFIVNFIVTTESPFGFINSSNREAWISFFGALIGGTMTLIGVRWTILDQSKKRQNDLAIQYRPILQSFPSEVGFRVMDNDIVSIEIEFKNKGRGEAIINKDSLNIHIQDFCHQHLNTANDIRGWKVNIIPAGDSYIYEYKVFFDEVLFQKFYDGEPLKFFVCLNYMNTFSKEIYSLKTEYNVYCERIDNNNVNVIMSHMNYGD